MDLQMLLEREREGVCVSVSDVYVFLHWPFSPDIVSIWCLLFLLFQAVD